MKTDKAKSIIENIESDLRVRLKETGAFHDTGLKQSDVSAWLNHRRNWSIEKILKIYDMLMESKK